eukprot:688169-Pyramimonas_sp.AAC.1
MSEKTTPLVCVVHAAVSQIQHTEAPRRRRDSTPYVYIFFEAHNSTGATLRALRTSQRAWSYQPAATVHLQHGETEGYQQLKTCQSNSTCIPLPFCGLSN